MSHLLLERLLVFNLATDADDPILGFTTAWLRALAARVGFIDVVTMRAGRLDLPANVAVYSVGKERGYSEPRRAVEFYRILGRLLAANRYEACFAHMMPVFALMGAPLLRRRGIPITLWYAHRATPLTLRLAHRLVDSVVTSSPESFRLPTRKLTVIGQGIDTDLFRPLSRERRDGEPFTLVAVGRVAPVKRIEVMVDALAALHRRLPPPGARLRLIGPVGDPAYAHAVVRRARDARIADRLELSGPLPQDRLPVALAACDLALNLTPDGSFDKAALEAMACGLPLVTTNRFLQDLVATVDARLVPSGSGPEAVADACHAVWALGPDILAKDGQALRELVVAGHSLERLAERLVAQLVSPPATQAGITKSRRDGPRLGAVAARELWRGKSVYRALLNATLAGRPDVVSGRVLDLACGTVASYRRILRGEIRWVGIDRFPTPSIMAVADMHALPLRDASVDGVVFSGALHISADPAAVLGEVARVLRSGGMLLLTTPLIFWPNPEPTDHWRFTDQGLALLLRRAGFDEIEIEPFGDRWSAAMFLLSPFLRPHLVAVGAGLLAILLDRLTRHLPWSPPCPMGYLAVARRRPAAVEGM